MKRLSVWILSVIATLLVSAEQAAALETGAISFDLPGDSPGTLETIAMQGRSSPEAVAAAPVQPAPDESKQASAPRNSSADVQPANAQVVSFAVPQAPVAEPMTAVSPATRTAPAENIAAPEVSAPSPETLFAGGSDSLVARTVGHAEGTRTAEGNKTAAYYGHSDPGNGVWNLGSFSFQHCREARYRCSTPQQADAHQLRRLQGQAQALRQRAAALGMTLTLEEELNGIDLANQAPLAALGQPEAYPEHLARARKQGLTGEDAILEGRVWGYWDGDRGRWAAPGLGNTEANIRHDQRRRMVAIARALAHQERQFARREENADRIIAQDLR